MKTQVLSVEQMKHLQELGVDTSKAKMSWYAIYETLPEWYNELNIRDDVFDKNYPSVPTLTLQDMLEIFPTGIKAYGDYFEFEIVKHRTTYEIRYVNCDREDLVSEEHSNLLICAYHLFCWLTEKGFLKGGKNEKRD